MPQIDASDPVHTELVSIREDGDHKSLDSVLRMLLREHDEDLEL